MARAGRVPGPGASGVRKDLRVHEVTCLEKGGAWLSSARGHLESARTCGCTWWLGIYPKTRMLSRFLGWRIFSRRLRDFHYESRSGLADVDEPLCLLKHGGPPVDPLGDRRGAWRILNHT